MAAVDAVEMDVAAKDERAGVPGALVNEEEEDSGPEGVHLDDVLVAVLGAAHWVLELVVHDHLPVDSGHLEVPVGDPGDVLVVVHSSFEVGAGLIQYSGWSRPSKPSR